MRDDYDYFLDEEEQEEGEIEISGELRLAGAIIKRAVEDIKPEWIRSQVLIVDRAIRDYAKRYPHRTEKQLKEYRQRLIKKKIFERESARYFLSNIEKSFWGQALGIKQDYLNKLME
jgi:hypothetical protein|tara:strand:- start:194 stop:544 length:351 start_codon:yes stop_codon:yes gene_type:complete